MAEKTQQLLLQPNAAFLPGGRTHAAGYIVQGSTTLRAIKLGPSFKAPYKRLLLGPCGALCAQIWPLGGQNRARGTFASLRTDGEISEVPRNTPFFHQLLGRNKHFPVFPSMIRACYGRCESLTTFQSQVAENEAWPQTGGSLKLPPVQKILDSQP